jgi:GH15 family glucan-1,4-alpha-glucosidase
VRLEDYGLIGDLQSAALVGNNGSVDWLCLPRFDSPSCFSAPRKRGARLLDRFTGWRSTRLLPPLSPWDASRGPRRHYTYSKVMAWVVFDRAVQLAERFALDGPVGAVEADSGRDPPGGLRKGLRRRAPHVHAVLRVKGA